MNADSKISVESCKFISDMLCGKFFVPSWFGIRFAIKCIHFSYCHANDKLVAKSTVDQICECLSSAKFDNVLQVALLYSDLHKSLKHNLCTFSDHGHVAEFDLFYVMIENKYGLNKTMFKLFGEIRTHYESLVQHTKAIRQQFKYFGVYSEQHKPHSSICMFTHQNFDAIYEDSKTKILYFEGLTINQIKMGMGTAKYVSGAMYIGFWQNNMREGYGEYFGDHIYKGGYV